MVTKFKLINFKGNFIWQKSDITIGHLLKKLSFGILSVNIYNA